MSKTTQVAFQQTPHYLTSNPSMPNEATTLVAKGALAHTQSTEITPFIERKITPSTGIFSVIYAIITGFFASLFGWDVIQKPLPQSDQTNPVMPLQLGNPFVPLLGNPFGPIEATNTGITNPGCSCFLNASLQMMLTSPKLKESLCEALTKLHEREQLRIYNPHRNVRLNNDPEHNRFVKMTVGDASSHILRWIVLDYGTTNIITDEQAKTLRMAFVKILSLDIDSDGYRGDTQYGLTREQGICYKSSIQCCAAEFTKRLLNLTNSKNPLHFKVESHYELQGPRTQRREVASIPENSQDKLVITGNRTAASNRDAAATDSILKITAKAGNLKSLIENESFTVGTTGMITFYERIDGRIFEFKSLAIQQNKILGSLPKELLIEIDRAGHITVPPAIQGGRPTMISQKRTNAIAVDPSMQIRFEQTRDLPRIIGGHATQAQSYQITSFVCHSGANANSGHYISYNRVCSNGRIWWERRSDSHIDIVEGGDAAAALLFQDTNFTPTLVHLSMI